MASYAHTFVSGETVTPTKLNNARTVSNIVNADISSGAAIALSKLATGALPSAITVASANIVDGTIVNDDINASAAIALSKLATGALPTGITVSSANIVDGTIVNGDINASAAIALSKLATGALPTGITVSSANLVDGTIVNADINASAAIDGSKLATATQQSLVPAGAVIPFAMNSAPSGWLAADGTAVSRTTYATLFAAIGTTHGSGDGSTTFNLPDLRGYFVRGSGTNSDGTAAGTFGGKQADGIRSHTHSASTSTNGAHAHTVSAADNLTGTFGLNANLGQFNLLRPITTTSNGDHSHTVTIGSTGGSETRPANIALLYCIKF